MQYFSGGYRPGDPRIRPAAEGRGAEQGPLPGEVDVLIVGSGPAGLLLAAQLSEFPEIVTRVVEKADGPLQVGRADGVNCRTVEMFEAFGLAEQDDRRGLLGQRDPLLGRRPAGQLPDHPPGPDPGRARSAVGVPARHRQPGPAAGLPAGAHAQLAQQAQGRLRPGGGQGRGPRRRRRTGHRHPAPRRRRRDEVIVRAKYVVGCDGAHSAIRAVHRPQDGAPGRGQGLGRDGPAGRHRLPRHPVQVHHPGRQRQEHPAHPPRGRAPVPPLRRHG